MIKNWFGTIVVFGIALGIVGIKAGCNSQASATSSSAPTPQAASPRVVLVADLSEAEEECGCGRIIRMVRTTAARGVPTVEINPRKDPDAAKRYKTVVTPTVIVLDDAGREARRYEGESKEMIKRIKEDLDKLPGKT